MRKLLAVSFILLGFSQAEPESVLSPPILGIWHATQEWDWRHEENFGAWLNEVAQDRDYFLRRGIGIDCADTVYGFRWIYARIHKLPAMTYSKRGLITNETVRDEWAQLPTAEKWDEDQRFLAALDLILRSTYTGTLPDDSYPVELSADALVPGTFFLNLQGSPHVDLIYKSDRHDPRALPFEFVTSSVPRQLKQTKYLSFWFESQPADHQNGFRRFLWPRKENDQWFYVEPEEMPFHSTEQFDAALAKVPFSDYVYDRMKPQQNREAMAQAAVNGLIIYLRERVDVVNEAVAYCKGRRSCKRKTSKDYDTHSTPSRDLRIEKHFAATVRQVERAHGPEAVKEIFAQHVVFELDKQPVTLAQLHEIWRKKKYSSEPSHDVYRRWGLTPPKKRRR